MQFSAAVMDPFDFDNSIEQDIVDLGQLRGQLKINEPMGKHVSWRAGGPQGIFIFPKIAMIYHDSCHCFLEKYLYI